MFTSYEQICDKLETVYRDVAASPIATDEEGNVLYFIKCDNEHPDDADKQQVLSLAKLKTLEYRLFRKMREKLRNFHDNDMPTGEEAQERIRKLITRFKSESRELLNDGDSALPRPMAYYTAVFAGAFDFLRQHPAEIKTLHEAFVTFSERLLRFMNKKKGKGENLESFFDSDILDRQDEI